MSERENFKLEIYELEKRIYELKKKSILLSDDKQWYREKLETRVLKKQTKNRRNSNDW